MTRLISVRLLVLLVISLPLAVGSALAAPAPAGSVVAARGSVDALDTAGTARALKVKGEIFATDTVRTGKDGRAQLMFKDNTIVSLGVNSVMKVAEYRWDGAQKDGAMKTTVEEGTFRVLGGLITKHSPKNFTTDTPAATIGIRGSMYAGKASKGRTVVAFLGGKGIVVYNPLGQVEITQPGYGVDVLAGQAPGEPRPMSLDELVQLLEGMTNEEGGEAVVSDRTTDFDRRTEGGLPFDPDGFAPPLLDFLRDVIAGQEQGTLLPQPAGLTGYATFEGTAVGLFEGRYSLFDRYLLNAFAMTDISAAVSEVVGPPPPLGPVEDRYLVSGYWGDMTDLRIYIDRDWGYIDGGAFDFLYDNDYGALDVYPVVDWNNNVYFNDGAFTAALTCDDGPCIDLWGGEGGSYYPDSGSYIMTASSAQFSPYVSWGYWGVTFTDDYGETFSTYRPGSLWIAGEKTENWLVNDIGWYNEGFVGEYRGPAYGIRLDDAGVTTLTGGRTTLFADFSYGDLWGSIAFDQHTINFEGYFTGEGSYNGSFNAWAAYPDNYDWNTNVTGAFYGPAAEAVGGSFHSTNQWTESSAPTEVYQGIFGGSLVNGPIPNVPAMGY